MSVECGVSDSKLIVVHDYQSAQNIANLLIEKLEELKQSSLNGQSSCFLLKQLKNIIYCIYYSTENQYTAFLHEIVSYVLLQMFKYDN